MGTPTAIKTGVVSVGAEVEGLSADLILLCGKGEGGRLEETAIDVGCEVCLSSVAKVEEVFLTLIRFRVREDLLWTGVEESEVLCRVEAGNIVRLMEIPEGAVGSYAAISNTVWWIVGNVLEFWSCRNRGILVVEYSKGLVVEVGIWSLSVTSGVDLQSLSSDPVVTARVLVGINHKVIAFSSMDDDVVQVGYWLYEEPIHSDEG